MQKMCNIVNFLVQDKHVHHFGYECLIEGWVLILKTTENFTYIYWIWNQPLVFLNAKYFFSSSEVRQSIQKALYTGFNNILNCKKISLWITVTLVPGQVQWLVITFEEILPQKPKSLRWKLYLTTHPLV